MKNLILIFLLLLPFAFSVSAQTDEARKVDEFESVNCDDYLARMDNFQIELSNNPTAKGYILIYEGKIPRQTNTRFIFVSPHSGEAKAYEKTMIRRMTFRKYDRQKIVFVEAGFREKLTVEFWVVPSNAEPPKPIPTLKKMKYQKGKPKDFCGNDLV